MTLSLSIPVVRALAAVLREFDRVFGLNAEARVGLAEMEHGIAVADLVKRAAEERR